MLSKRLGAPTVDRQVRRDLDPHILSAGRIVTPLMRLRDPNADSFAASADLVTVLWCP